MARAIIVLSVPLYRRTNTRHVKKNQSTLVCRKDTFIDLQQV
jgi:hypothetical protein